MSKLTINTGDEPNDRRGDSLRAAFTKVNTNFTELYTALGIDDGSGLNLGAFEFSGSTLSTTDSSAIVIDQAATITSNLTVGGDILPQTANGGDLGSSTLPWRSLYVSNNTIYIGGTAVGLDANGNLTVNGSRANAPGSTLVNGANTVSLGSDGALILPEGAVVQTTSGNLTIEAENYVIIDSSTDGQIEIGRNSGVGAVILGNKSLGTNSIIDSDLLVNHGVYEEFSSLADATGTVTHNCDNGHIFYHTSPDANWTVNLTNFNSIWGRATSVTLIIVQGATGYYPNALQIAGVAQTINWQGNVNPTPSTNRTDVVTFSIINNSGTYIVLGQLTGF